LADLDGQANQTNRLALLAFPFHFLFLLLSIQLN